MLRFYTNYARPSSFLIKQYFEVFSFLIEYLEAILLFKHNYICVSSSLIFVERCFSSEND